jgi:hypothetical protein
MGNLPNPQPNNVIFLVPAHRYIEPEVEEGLRMLESRGYRVGRMFGCSAIDQARCELAYLAMEAGREYLFWIDSDVAFRLSDVERLLSHREHVVCGLYRAKKDRVVICGDLLDVEGGAHFGRGGPGLQEIRYPPGGFTCVHRSVYEATGGEVVYNRQFGTPLKPWYLPMTIEDHDGPRYLSEDFAFGERVRAAGYPIYADFSLILGHIGNHTYRLPEGVQNTARLVQGAA